MLRGWATKFAFPTAIHFGSGLNHILQDAATTHRIKNVVLDSRAQQEPLYEEHKSHVLAHRYNQAHHANDSTFFIDEKLTITREEFRIYRNFDKEMQLGKYILYPVLLGFNWMGLLPLVYGFFTNASTGGWGVNLTRKEGESYEDALIRRHAEIIDHERARRGACLNRHLWKAALFDIRDGTWKTPYDNGAAYHHIRNLFFSQIEAGKPDVTLVPELGWWCKMQFNSGEFRQWAPSKARGFWRNVIAFIDKPWSLFSYNTIFRGAWEVPNENIGWQLHHYIQDLLQDDQFIKRDGGTAVLTDKELLVSCLERGICRVEENLPREVLRKRLEDWLYLSNFRLPSFTYVAWASTYHWDGALYDDTDPWKDVPRAELNDAFPEMAVAPDVIPPTGSLNDIIARGTVIPDDSPDMDPFIDLQPSFSFRNQLERDAFETFRESWLRSDDPAHRVNAFKALADHVADAAPAYVRQQTPDVQKAIITAATHNLLLRGPNTKFPVSNETTAEIDVAGISPAAAAVFRGNNLVRLAEHAASPTWQLPETFVHELREFITPRDLYNSPNKYIPRDLEPHAIRLNGHLKGNNWYEQPRLWTGQRPAPRGGTHVLEPSFVSPRVVDFEMTHIDAPVKRGDL